MVSLIQNKRNTYLRIAFLLSICLSVRCQTEDASISIDEVTPRPEVSIPQGRLRGVNIVSRNGRNFFGFKGIPFARPPIGNLRFKAPLPAGPWNGTLDASTDPSPCTQNLLFTEGIKGGEDCLYLNVYTPRLPTSSDLTLLPVMLYIHGGAFIVGQNDFDEFGPHFILDEDVIVVIPQYRLGVFGFLSTGDEASPGNYGLKDQVRALEWNRDNIRYFGGDPNRVTIFGESAGGISVHLLTLSNLTNGLFHRYITESGSALSYETQKPQAVLTSRAIRLGEHFGCPTNTSLALVNCLRGIEALQLVQTDQLFRVWADHPAVTWCPTVEPDLEGAFLTDSPLNLLDAGKIRDVPWLCSVNRNEGLVFTSKFYKQPNSLEEFLDEIDVALPAMLSYSTIVENVTAFTDALKSYYLNDLTANRTVLLNNVTQLIGDGLFVYSTYSASQKHLAHAKSPQYFCSFEYRGTYSYSYLYGGGNTEDCGVSHADETIYLFWQEYSRLGPPGIQMNEADWKMVDRMVRLWTSFAKTGIPTTADSHTAAIWQPYDPSRKNYLRIGNNADTTISVGYDHLGDRMRFWEELTAATSWK